MRNPLWWCISAALAVVATTASALPGTFSIDQIYSNADGTVQFVTIFDRGMNDCDAGENFWTGLTLESIGPGGNRKVFTFGSNLPTCRTSGRNMLIATEGFAALGLVAPDYVIPNGFVPFPSGRIIFANISEVSYSALPSDGVHALLANGTVVQNVATNLAGARASVVPSSAAASNYQGLWYKAPAESESGWGVNIAHQGDTFFVTWFTYDTNGSQMWLVGPSVTKGSGNSYSGDLYRTTGPAFNSVPFTPIGASNISQVGTVTFSFADANNGTFGYTVNGVTQSKAITRQVFGPLPNCTAGGTTGTPGVLNYQDLWYASPAGSESGWGVNVTHQGDILFLAWFTYDTSGRGMWVVGPRMERSGTSSIYTGLIYRTTGPAFNANPWSPSGVQATQVGTATMTFTSGSAGTFNYTVNDITQTKNITRQVFGSPATVCR